MDVLQQDYYFWQLVHFFVFERECRVIDMSGTEVWLEEEDSKPRRIIRLVRTDVDWANWLKRDIVESAKKFEFVRRELRLGTIEGENIYVSMFPPVDSWEHLQNPMTVGKNKKTLVRTTLLFQEDEQKEQIVSKRLSFYQIPIFPKKIDISEIELNIINLQQVIRKKVKEQENFERSLFTHGKPNEYMELVDF